MPSPQPMKKRGKPKASPVKVTKADGTVEVVPASAFDRQRDRWRVLSKQAEAYYRAREEGGS